MNTRIRLCICLALAGLVSSGHVIGAKDTSLPRLPGAALLVGYGPTNLRLTGPSQTVTIQPVGNEPASWGHHTLVMLSSRGQIGTARLKAARHEVVATYSVSEKKWAEFVEVHHVWAVAVSPDGSQLAVVGEQRAPDLRSRDLRLQIIDTRTGGAKVLVSDAVSPDAAPSWSPDGRRIAYESNSAIQVLDLETGQTRKLIDGQHPAWSPSGEWIAFLDNTGDPGGGTKCLAVRPDGSGAKTLVAFKRRSFRPLELSPVWSPDSTELLVNQVSDWEAWKMDVYLLKLSTGKLTRISKDGVPVLGWASLESVGLR